jgi:hypothetical protein
MFCITCQEKVTDCSCSDREMKLTKLSGHKCFICPVPWCIECNRPLSCCDHKDEEVTHIRLAGTVHRKLDLIAPI